MSSPCPECGTSLPSEARFCMGCGHERPPEESAEEGPAVPPPPASPPPPAAPPVPAYGPSSARPSPVGAFFSRALTGDWATSARVAVWPLLTVFLLACALGLYSNEDLDDLDIGWGDRMRVALALLLQGVGGGFSYASDDDVPVGGEIMTGEGSLSFVPYLSTALWVAALVLASRWARRRAHAAGRHTGGFEAALRVGLLGAAGAFALGLYACPSYEGFELDSSPGLTLLGAFLLTAVVGAAVLARGEIDTWLGARQSPGPRAAVGALRTALLALVLVLALASVVAGIVVLTQAEGDALDAEGWLGLLLVLPNLGVMALALAWGAPLEGEWNVPELDTGRDSFGYGQLGEAAGGWAVFGALAGGLVCALILGTLVARRHADRREQLLAGAFFVASVLLLAGLGSIEAEAGFHERGGEYGVGDSVSTSIEGGTSGAETLLFTLLWSFGGVLLVPWALTLAGKGAAVAGAPPYAPAPPAVPSGAGAASASEPVATSAPASAAASASGVPSSYDAPAYRLGQDGAPGGAPRLPGTALKWTALIVSAFLVGGAVTGGVLLFSDDDGGGKGKGGTSQSARDDKPAPKDASPEPSAEDTAPSSDESPPDSAPASPSGSATGSAGESGLPEGFAMVDDPEGFRVGVMEGWQREIDGSQIDYEQPTGSDYLRIGIIENAGYTSYGNFLSMEAKAKGSREDYDRVGMKRNTFHGRPGARWEFTYTNDSGRLIHASDQAYIAEDGTEYSIYSERAAYAGEEDKPDIVFEAALDSWQEPGDG